MTTKWTAVLGRVDEQFSADDPRSIAADGTFSVRGDRAPVRAGFGGPIVGEVTAVAIRDGELVATVVIYDDLDPDVAASLPELIPAPDFTDVQYQTIITAGSVTGLNLGTHPAGPGASLTRDRFTCPRCGKQSSHPKDLAEGFCGACHAWTGTPQPKG